MGKTVFALPIGTDRDEVKRTINVLHEEYKDKLKCSLSDRRILSIEYNNLEEGEILSIGVFLGRNITMPIV